MIRRIRFVSGLVLLLICAGCGAADLLVGLLQPHKVTVSLVNNGDFAVQVKLFIADNQDLPEALLTDIGTELDYTINAGASASFSRNCDDLQALVIDDAELMVIGGSGPTASSDVLRDGSDFGCGDTIVFTFDHSNLILDFDVSANVRSD